MQELGTEADEPTQTQNSTVHVDGEAAIDSQLQLAAPGTPGEQSAAQPSNEQAAPQEQPQSSVVNTTGTGGIHLPLECCRKKAPTGTHVLAGIAADMKLFASSGLQSTLMPTRPLPPAGEALAADSGGGAREDAVARRTRAQQSLIDCSLEELEALLQLDAEDAAAKEDAEYEAFIQVGNTQSCALQ